MKHTRHILLIVTLLAGLLAGPSSAFADHESDGDGTVVVFFPGLLTTTTVGVAITIASSPGWMTLSTSTTSTDITDSSARHAEAYMRLNNAALRQGLALGGGEAIDDLAHIFRVPSEHRARFAKELRAHRSELLPLLELEKLDTDRAARFMETVGDTILADEEMRDDWWSAVRKASS
jgi:hypothetical protein